MNYTMMHGSTNIKRCGWRIGWRVGGAVLRRGSEAVVVDLVRLACSDQLIAVNAPSTHSRNLLHEPYEILARSLGTTNRLLPWLLLHRDVK